jgi:hypothetical protein
MTANYADSSERQARANALGDAADALRKIRLTSSGLAQTKLASNIETGELILVASWIIDGTTGVDMAARIEDAMDLAADSSMQKAIETTRAVWETTGKPEPKVDDQPTVAYSPLDEKLDVKAQDEWVAKRVAEELKREAVQPLEAYRQDPRKITYPSEYTGNLLDDLKRKAVQPHTRPVRDNPQA